MVYNSLTLHVVLRSCREWYDTGRKYAHDNNLYVNAPYQSAADRAILQSATSPLVDPRTKEYVGQTLIDFYTESAFKIIKDEGTEDPVLITIEGVDDTVIAPGFNLSQEEAKPIADVLFEENAKCMDHVCANDLEKIIKSMKNGSSSKGEFRRRKNDHSPATEVWQHIAYEPVVVKSLRSLDSSDFSRGVFFSDVLIYSLGYAKTESAIFQPFNKSEGSMKRQIIMSVAILAAVIVVTGLVVIYISYRVTISITKSMLYLLHLIKAINRQVFMSSSFAKK